MRGNDMNYYMKFFSATSSFFIIVLCLLGLPGCGSRIMNWGKTTFYQGCDIVVDTTVADNAIRSISVYDQLTTRGHFDALLLSDEVRKLYAHIFAHKQGKSHDQYISFLRRQWEENKHYISFYVLTSYGQPLGDQHSEWIAFLKVGDREVAPIEVKSVDLSAEYRLLFGTKFNRFKVAYSLKFNRTDLADFADDNYEQQIALGPDKIVLVFRSLDKEVSLCWDNKNGKDNKSGKNSKIVK
jgi:hypothetical protein